MKKYILTSDIINVNGIEMRRIKAIRDFGTIRTGSLGGYVESEKNLSHRGTCWVAGNAKVGGRARVSGNARVGGNALVIAPCFVAQDGLITGDVQVLSLSLIFGRSWAYGSFSTGKKPMIMLGGARVFGDRNEELIKPKIAFGVALVKASSSKIFHWRR